MFPDQYDLCGFLTTCIANYTRITGESIQHASKEKPSGRGEAADEGRLACAQDIKYMEDFFSLNGCIVAMLN